MLDYQIRLLRALWAYLRALILEDKAMSEEKPKEEEGKEDEEWEEEEW